MDTIDTLISGRMTAPATPATGDVPVWNGTAWVKSSGAQKVSVSALAGFPADVTKVLKGDGSWGPVTPPVTYIRKTTAKVWSTSVSESTDLFNGELTIPILSTASTVRVTVWMDTNNTTGASQTFTWRVKIGATPTIVFDTGAGVDQPTGSRYPSMFEIKMQNLGVTNSQAWQMLHMPVRNVAANFTTGEGIRDSTGLGGAVGFNTTAIDTTATQSLVLTVQHQSASATQETKLWAAFMEVIL